jgi:hypothetical protein
VIGGSCTFCFDVTAALGFGFSLTFCDMALSLADVDTLISSQWQHHRHCHMQLAT